MKIAVLEKWKRTTGKFRRLKYKGLSIGLKKAYGSILPEMWISIWNDGITLFYFGYEMFHNGWGWSLQIPYFSISICTSGKIGWWYPKGILFLRIGKYRFEY